MVSNQVHCGSGGRQLNGTKNRGKKWEIKMGKMGKMGKKWEKNGQKMGKMGKVGKMGNDLYVFLLISINNMVMIFRFNLSSSLNKLFY